MEAHVLLSFRPFLEQINTIAKENLRGVLCSQILCCGKKSSLLSLPKSQTSFSVKISILATPILCPVEPFMMLVGYGGGLPLYLAGCWRGSVGSHLVWALLLPLSTISARLSYHHHGLGFREILSAVPLFLSVVSTEILDTEPAMTFKRSPQDEEG